MRNIYYSLYCIFFLTFYIQAQDVYVSPTGKDSNNGTEFNEFKTIKHALTVLKSRNGGICYLKSGTYHETIVLNGLKNTIIKNYQSDFVKLDGTVAIEQTWTASDGLDNTYQTNFSTAIWQLFIADKQQINARWPNAKFEDNSIYNHHNWVQGETLTDSDNGKMIDKNGNLANINANDALIIANIGSFRTFTLPVDRQENNTLFYKSSFLDPTYFRGKEHFFYLEGKKEFIDSENEWFFDGEKIYVYGNPNDKEVRAKVQDYFFEFEQADNLTLEGLHFYGNTLIAKKSKNVTLKNCVFTYPSASRRMLKDEFPSKNHPTYPTLSMNNNQKYIFEYKYTKVTELGGNYPNEVTNFVVEECLFEHTEGEALYLTGSNNRIENNFFHHIDFNCADVRGIQNSIFNNGNNLLFTKNTLHTSGASEGLLPGNSAEISYNDISNIGLAQSDGALIQLTRHGVKDCNIHHNWLHDAIKYGLRFDAPAGEPEIAGRNGLVHHNVLWNLVKGMMIKGDDQEIYNNTCFEIEQNDIIILDEANSNKLTKLYNNAADKISAIRIGAKNLPINPNENKTNVYADNNEDYGIKDLLQDPNNYDFRLVSNSVLDVQGTAVSGVTDGVDGNSKIGAYDNSNLWKAGIENWSPNFYPWNNDHNVTADLNISNNVMEGNPVIVEINLSQIPTVPVTLHFKIESSSEVTSDLLSDNYEVTLEANQMYKTFEITTVDDSIIEKTETFTISIDQTTSEKDFQFSASDDFNILDNDQPISDERSGFVIDPSFEMYNNFIDSDWTSTKGDALISFQNQAYHGNQVIRIEPQTVYSWPALSLLNSKVYPVTASNPNESLKADLSFWAKLDSPSNQEVKVLIKNGHQDLTESNLYFTTEWKKYAFSKTFNGQENYQMSVEFRLGLLDVPVQIDRIQSSLSQSVTLGPNVYKPYLLIDRNQTSEGDNLLVNFELSEEQNTETTIHYSFNHITTDSNDFSDQDSSFTLPANTLTYELLIPTNDDNIVENDEEFGITIDQSSNEQIAFNTTPTLFTIFDNDSSGEIVKNLFYPNPVKENLNIRFINKIKKVNVYNSLGKLFLKKDIDATNEARLNLKHLKSGYYIIEIIEQDGHTIRESFIKS